MIYIDTDVSAPINGKAPGVVAFFTIDGDRKVCELRGDFYSDAFHREAAAAVARAMPTVQGIEAVALEQLRQKAAKLVDTRPVPLSIALPPEPEPKAPPPPPPPSGPRPKLVNLADVEPQPVEWLWPGKVAIGKLTLIGGDPGLGKSFLTIDMAARVSTGSPWPDAPTERTKAGHVIICNAEDDLADTIRPRLDAAGADVTKVTALLGSQRLQQDGSTRDRSFSLADLLTLQQTLEATPGVRLVIVDPVSAFLADTESHNNAEVRALLAPLAKLATDYGCAIVLVTHLSKAPGGRAMYRLMGSQAFIAAARMGWLVSQDKANDRRRLLLPIKNNLAVDTSGLAFTIGGDPARVVWERDAVTMRADEALAAEDPVSGQDAARVWLVELLADGPKPVVEVEDQGRQAGITKAQLRRAREHLRIKPEKEGFGGRWMWGLPPRCAPPKMRAPSATPARTFGSDAHLCDFNSTNGGSGTLDGIAFPEDARQTET